MADARTREPTGSAKHPVCPALASRPKCPNCGRERAIVFRQLREHEASVAGAPLVCLDCCAVPCDRP
jgi:hypothetical protein